LVSQELGKKIVERIHEEYGHLGTQQMLATSRPYYYFKNLDETVHEYCQSCHTCVTNKTRRGRAIGLLSRLGPATRPYEIMSIDTVGGFGGCGSIAGYIHILEDHFTRYVWILTSKGQTSREFIRLIEPLAETQDIMMLLVDQYTGINSEFSHMLIAPAHRVLMSKPIRLLLIASDAKKMPVIIKEHGLLSLKNV